LVGGGWRIFGAVALSLRKSAELSHDFHTGF